MPLLELNIEDFKKFTKTERGKELSTALVNILLASKQKPSTKAAYIGRMITQLMEFMENEMEIKKGHLIGPFVGSILERLDEIGVVVAAVELKKIENKEEKEEPEKVFVSNGNDEIH